MNYYKILGIKQDATPEQIKSAYRELARKHHPDTAKGKCSTTFQSIHEAYKNLIDPDRRRRHDRDLSGKSSGQYHPSTHRSSPPVTPIQPVSEHFQASEDFLGMKSEREPYEVDLNLSRREAQMGGTLVFEIPPGIFSLTSTRIPVHIPPGVRDRTWITESLRRYGIRDRELRIQVHLR